MRKNYLIALIILFIGSNLEAQITLTQSNNSTLIDTEGRACALTSSPFTYSDNYFYRVYDLNAKGITGDFQISSLEYGQGKANDGIIITLNVYTVDTDDLTTANFTFVGQTTHTSSSLDNLSLISKPLSLNIPSGSIIAFEIFVAANSNPNTNEDFIPGYNTAGELDDSYIRILDCTFPDPVTLKSLGLPDEYVMNIVGSEVLGTKEFNSFELSIRPNPTSSIINVELDVSNTLKKMNLYNITGQVIYSNLKSNNLDISSLKSGIYLLEIITENGKATRKIIKN